MTRHSGKRYCPKCWFGTMRLWEVQATDLVSGENLEYFSMAACWDCGWVGGLSELRTLEEIDRKLRWRTRAILVFAIVAGTALFARDRGWL